MSCIINSGRFFSKSLKPLVRRRYVSTSPKKNTDTITADSIGTKTGTASNTAEAAEKNWISYGFSYTSKKEDRSAFHVLFFGSITLGLTCGSFYLAYAPDFTLQDWATREAFLEIRRREAAGLPHVDPNFIPADKMVLPSDEELGDMDIII